MRLRILFEKTGALRYTGHLDLHSIWERTVRRAGLPLAYTQGFHPGPKIQIAAALPLGFIGRAEIVDLWLKEDAEPSGLHLQELLQAAAPPGLHLTSLTVVDEHEPALQTRVDSAEYDITLLEACGRATLEMKVSDLLQSTSLPRERRGKPYDLRPLIESLVVIPGTGESLHMQMRLAARNGATGRPEEVLDALGIKMEATRIERTALILR